MPSARRILVLVAALCAALAVAGCGNKTGMGRQLEAQTEGLYLDLNDLTYQVQISRYINPNDVEDRAYLLGLPANAEQPAGDETWFGVWVRVQNETDHTIRSASDFEIRDTQDNVFRPVPLDPKANVFAYQPADIPAGSLIPAPDSAASDGPIQGALLLFRVTTDSLQNRPLEFRISGGGGGPTAVVDLDV